VVCCVEREGRAAPNPLRGTGAVPKPDAGCDDRPLEAQTVTRRDLITVTVTASRGRDMQQEVQQTELCYSALIRFVTEFGVGIEIRKRRGPGWIRTIDQTIMSRPL
jgi:hypothetical protein